MKEKKPTHWAYHFFTYLLRETIFQIKCDWKFLLGLGEMARIRDLIGSIFLEKLTGKMPFLQRFAPSLEMLKNQQVNISKIGT